MRSPASGFFWHKFNPNGSLSHYKARWVVWGFSQQAGIDYSETFSLVIKPATIRVVLSITASHSWLIHQLDVKNDFLHDTRKSTSGCCVFVGNNLVSWSSKRKVTVSRSSTEAKYRGVANAVTESYWLRQLLLELHHPPQKATVVFCNNDKVSLGEIKVLHVPSSHQFVDIFTKGLSTTLFQEFRSNMQILPEIIQAARGCQRTNTSGGSHLMHGPSSSSLHDSGNLPTT